MASWLIIRRRHVLEGFGRTRDHVWVSLSNNDTVCLLFTTSSKCQIPTYLFVFIFFPCVCVYSGRTVQTNKSLTQKSTAKGKHA